MARYQMITCMYKNRHIPYFCRGCFQRRPPSISRRNTRSDASVKKMLILAWSICLTSQVENCSFQTATDVATPNDTQSQGTRSWRSESRQTINVGADGGEPGDCNERHNNLIAIPDCNSVRVTVSRSDRKVQVE